MLDHATLSASGRSLTSSSFYSLRNTQQRENVGVVSDLSASGEHSHRNLLSLQEAVQGSFEVASSLALTKMLETGYFWQEERASQLFFIDLSQLLKQWYGLRNQEEIVQLLEDYPLLHVYFVDIHRYILTYFPGAKLFLEAIAESEADDDLEATSGNENVVVSIVTRIRPREAIDRLKHFYRDWWLQAPNRAKMKDKISFNVECV